MVLVEDVGDKERKGSIRHLKEKVAAKGDLEETELRVMASEKKVKKEKVVKAEEGEGFIADSFGDEDLEHDQGQKVVAVKEVLMVRPVATME